MIRRSEQARARWSAALRVMAATLGAYGLTSFATVVSSLLLVRLGMAKVEAVTAATLASFALFAVVAMSAFHARSGTRAWACLGAASFALGLLWLALAANVP